MVASRANSALREDVVDVMVFGTWRARGVMPLSGAQGWDSVVFSRELTGIDMKALRTRNLVVACFGIVAFLGLMLCFPVLLQRVQIGEASVLHAAPVVVGALLLLTASICLLMRWAAYGWLFAIAAIELLLGLFWLPWLRLSPWPWLAVLAASAGAIIGFRKGRGDEAAD